MQEPSLEPQQLEPVVEVVVVDDHPAVRAALRRLLDREKDIAVVGEAGSGAETLLQVDALEPDVVLLDVNMAEMSGLEVLEALRGQDWPRAIVVSMYTNTFLIEQALAGGAAGYVSKGAVVAELVPAVRTVAAGGTYLCRVARAALAAE